MISHRVAGVVEPVKLAMDDSELSSSFMASISCVSLFIARTQFSDSVAAAEPKLDSSKNIIQAVGDHRQRLTLFVFNPKPSEGV
ncbi:MAG: hypothetical protein ISS61_08005 [Desulfobacteraceae bacterium]|nr:hypothetical protein [Desulfobacteraceae bacterium]